MEKKKIESMVIEGVTYVPESEVNQNAEKHEGMDYVLIRSNRAGVFIGYLKSKEETPHGRVVTLVNSRNIFYWNGAAGISQIAEHGISDHSTSKLTITVSLREISDVIELLPINKTAKENLDNIPVWKK